MTTYLQEAQLEAYIQALGFLHFFVSIFACQVSLIFFYILLFVTQWVFFFILMYKKLNA